VNGPEKDRRDRQRLLLFTLNTDAMQKNQTPEYESSTEKQIIRAKQKDMKKNINKHLYT
jgi:hypothetical protein